MDCTYLHIIYKNMCVQYMVEAQTMWNGKHAKVRCVSFMTSPRLSTVEQSVIDPIWSYPVHERIMGGLLKLCWIHFCRSPKNAMHAPRVPKWSSTGLVVSTLGSISWSSPSRSSTSMHLELALATGHGLVMLGSETKPAIFVASKDLTHRKVATTQKMTLSRHFATFQFDSLWLFEEEVKPSLIRNPIRWPNVAAGLQAFIIAGWHPNSSSQQAQLRTNVRVFFPSDARVLPWISMVRTPSSQFLQGLRARLPKRGMLNNTGVYHLEVFKSSVDRLCWDPNWPLYPLVVSHGSIPVSVLKIHRFWWFSLPLVYQGGYFPSAPLQCSPVTLWSIFWPRSFHNWDRCTVGISALITNTVLNTSPNQSSPILRPASSSSLFHRWRELVYTKSPIPAMV